MLSVNYFKVTKFSDTLDVVILHLTKLAQTKFSNSINLSVVVIMHFSVY